MTLGQTLITILSVLLLATILLGLYNGMMTQVEHAQAGIYFSQGIKVANAVADKYEAYLLGEKISFTYLYNQLQNPNSSYAKPTPIVIGDASYQAIVRSEYCNENGTVVSDPSSLPIKFQRIYVSVDITTPTYTYKIGYDKDENSFSKILSDIN